MRPSMSKSMFVLLLFCVLQLGIWYKEDAIIFLSQQSSNKFFRRDSPRSRINFTEYEEKRLKLSPYVESPSDEIKIKNYRKRALAKTVKSIYWMPKTRDRWKECPISNCKFTYDFVKADLVVFDMYEMWNNNVKARKTKGRQFLTAIPKLFERPKNQRWAIFTIDPPFWMEALAGVYPELIASFNLTVSYRLDADLTFHFGKLKKWPSPVNKDYEALFANKTGSAVWVVSHCITESRREEYVARMNPIVGVDVLGKCGNVQRPGCGNKNDWLKPGGCIPSLGKEYKFYLAFENHLCPDYITEKYFKLFDGETDLIPVVRGGFDYKRYLPSGTYIDAADFKSPEDLAQYLVELGNDKERYINMWRTKDKWRLSPQGNYCCKLCELAHTHQNHVGYHPNFVHSFYGGVQDSCRKPTDI